MFYPGTDFLKKSLKTRFILWEHSSSLLVCCHDLYPSSISLIRSNLGAHILSRKLIPIDVEPFVALFGHSKWGLKLDYILSRDRFPQLELGNCIHPFRSFSGTLPWLWIQQHFFQMTIFCSVLYFLETGESNYIIICFVLSEYEEIAMNLNFFVLEMAFLILSM